MITEVLNIDAISPDPSDIKKVAELLEKGAIVSIPTETVYGLAVNADDKTALEKLYTVKKRPKGKQITIQIEGISRLREYTDDIPIVLEVLLKEFWPGPLTIIINTTSGKKGFRMPDNKVSLSIIKESGISLAVTSANLSGEKSAVSAGEVKAIFDGAIDLIVDDGTTAEGIESTVLDCTTAPFNIIREGAVADKLKRFLRLYG